VFASKPHFLDGDPALSGNLTGMEKPNRANDDTYLDFEPVNNAVELGLFLVICVFDRSLVLCFKHINGYN
jgi:hypothetical protein